MITFWYWTNVIWCILGPAVGAIAMALFCAHKPSDFDEGWRIGYEAAIAYMQTRQRHTEISPDV